MLEISAPASLVSHPSLVSQPIPLPQLRQPASLHLFPFPYTPAVAQHPNVHPPQKQPCLSIHPSSKPLHPNPHAPPLPQPAQASKPVPQFSTSSKTASHVLRLGVGHPRWRRRQRWRLSLEGGVGLSLSEKNLWAELEASVRSDSGVSVNS